MPQKNRRDFLKILTKVSAGISISGILLPLNCSRKEDNLSQTETPNIVFIMIDDLGYGDVGCYGSKVNHTPNIDRLAARGFLCTDYHSNGPMCTPTRASLLTGMYQHRFGDKFEGALSGKNDYDDGLPLQAVTIAEILKEAGYTTGMYGKWHLGYHPPYLPANQGFDDFIGLGSGDGDHFTHINRWGRKDWWHNNRLEMEKGYTTDLITQHSIDFINRYKDRPFFLYVSHLSIHFPWQGPDDPPHRQEGKDYTNDKWGIIPDKRNVSPHVKSMIESLDQGVGRIVETLKNLDLEKNTLVIFTSDNGGYIHYGNSHFNISSNGPLRGQKTEVYEGGHRVPFIAYWPGKIRGGTISNEIIMTMDMFPTFLELANLKIPKNLKLDGISIASHLFKKEILPQRSVYWKIDHQRAIRKGRWKLCLINDQNPELYDLDRDIGEKMNLAVENPELVNQLRTEYNIWEKDVTLNYR
jgi:arylsulfatase A